jgi:hypothetical protein
MVTFYRVSIVHVFIPAICTKVVHERVLIDNSLEDLLVAHHHLESRVEYLIKEVHLRLTKHINLSFNMISGNDNKI